GKRLLSGSHLVNHDAERKKIGAPVEFFTQRLLRRHIGHRSDRAAWTREQRRAAVRRHRRDTHRVRHTVPLRRQLGQTKIEYLRLAALRDKKISRFYVAVDDSP